MTVNFRNSFQVTLRSRCHTATRNLNRITNKSWEALSSLLYIIFVKFFLPIIPTFRFRSQRYFTSYWLFFHMLHFPHLYLFLVSSVFSNVPDFYMCSHSPFHMLSFFFPCALTLFTTFSELLWHLIFLCFIFVMLPTYPDAVYKPMYLLSSSSVCKLMLILLLSYFLSKFPLPSVETLGFLTLILRQFTKTNTKTLRPSLTEDLRVEKGYWFSLIIVVIYMGFYIM